MSKCRPVLCVEDGIEYESAAAAGKSFGVTSQNISLSCLHGTRAGGKHFRYLDADPAKSRKGLYKLIIDWTAGTVYESVSQCARVLGVTYEAAWQALNKGRPAKCKGHYIEDATAFYDDVLVPNGAKPIKWECDFDADRFVTAGSVADPYRYKNVPYQTPEPRLDMDPKKIFDAYIKRQIASVPEAAVSRLDKHLRKTPDPKHVRLELMLIYMVMRSPESNLMQTSIKAGFGHSYLSTMLVNVTKGRRASTKALRHLAESMKKDRSIETDPRTWQIVESLLEEREKGEEMSEDSFNARIVCIDDVKVDPKNIEATGAFFCAEYLS